MQIVNISRSFTMGHKTLIGASQGKFWGSTRCLFVNESCEMHCFEANKDGYCSKHYHENKWNRFVVLSGRLKVIIFKDSGQDETILTAGMFSDVPPKVDHKFEALEDTTALEIYWTDGLDPSDIVRKDSGGMKSNENEKNSAGQ